MAVTVAAVLSVGPSSAKAVALDPQVDHVAAAQGGAGEVPMVVRDDEAGDWVVDRFVGNSTGGSRLFQGPAVQTGGMGRGQSLTVAPDGRVYFIVSGGIMEVATNGMARLVISRRQWQADGLDDLYGRSGLVAWNPKEQCLYLWGRHCIRKLVEKTKGPPELAVVVGNPNKPGLDDGPVAQATLNNVGCLCINSRGTVFFYDGHGYGERLRRLEGGVVSTVTDKLRAGRLVDGPLADARFNFINLGGLNSCGESDDVLYVADHWNGVVRRLDMKAGAVTTVAGWPKRKDHPLPGGRAGGGDGPALTHTSFISGCVFAIYDSVHHAVWCGGPDEGRLRRLRLKDGWVKTVMGGAPRPWDPDGFNNPADSVKMRWTWVVAVDGMGRAYVVDGGNKTGYWRLYNRKEVKP